MKHKFMIAVLFGTFCGGQLLGMEEKKGSLQFWLGLKYNLGGTVDQFPIESYRQDKMDFAVDPSVFMGKNMLEVVPLSDVDRDNVAAAFDKAVNDGTKQKVSYTLDQKQYVARITAFRDSEDMHAKKHLLVKVTEKQ